ncbi:cadherin EGF LAG seven-pass G-type receptor 2-like [Glandiceps talaboti]
MSDKGCQQNAVFMYFVLLTVNAWLLCQSIQVFIKVRYFVYVTTKRRLLYIVIGWLVPALLTISLLALDDEGATSYMDGCTRSTCDGRLLVTLVVSSMIAMGSIVFISASHVTFIWSGNAFIDFEKERLWNDLLTTTLLHPILTLTWIFQIMASLNNNMLYGYLLAVSVFILGSVVYLGFSGANEEILEGIRVLLSRNALLVDFWKEVKSIEVQRYALKRQKELESCGNNKVAAENTKNEIALVDIEDTKEEGAE